MARVTAVFDDRTQAERAITELRRRGIPDAQMSVVSRRADDVEVKKGATDDNTGERMGKGALAGAGVGTLFGLAALAIPGVGPFITAGVLASALGVTGGAIASGAIVGGASGALAGVTPTATIRRESRSRSTWRLCPSTSRLRLFRPWRISASSTLIRRAAATP